MNIQQLRLFRVPSLFECYAATADDDFFFALLARTLTVLVSVLSNAEFDRFIITD